MQSHFFGVFPRSTICALKRGAENGEIPLEWSERIIKNRIHSWSDGSMMFNPKKISKHQTQIRKDERVMVERLDRTADRFRSVAPFATTSRSDRIAIIHRRDHETFMPIVDALVAQRMWEVGSNRRQRQPQASGRATTFNRHRWDRIYRAVFHREEALAGVRDRVYCAAMTWEAI